MSGISERFIPAGERTRPREPHRPEAGILARARDGFGLLRRDAGIRSLVAIQAGMNLILPPL
ncbi:MAG: hypothetical protein ACOC1U_03905, partial [Spirochaetota bacterium]